MFDAEDFELTLEKQLRLRVIHKEIDDCKDYDELKVQLKKCSEMLMKYQHLLSITLKKQLEKEMSDFMSIIGGEEARLNKDAS